MKTQVTIRQFLVITMIFLLLAISTGAVAATPGDIRIGAILGSYHLSGPPAGVDEWEENNFGWEVEYQINENLFAGYGKYDPNSIGEKSRFFGLGLRMIQTETWDFGLEIGGASGYKKVNIYTDHEFMSGLFYQPRWGNHSMKLRYMGSTFSSSYQYIFDLGRK